MPGNEEHPRIEPIEGGSRGQIKQVVTEAQEEIGVSKAKFDEALSKADTSKVELRRDVVAPEPLAVKDVPHSPIAVAAQANTEVPKVTPTPESLAAQASELRKQLERPRALLLETKTLDAQTVSKLTSSIGHIDRALQDASRLTTGVEKGSMLAAGDTSKPPIVRFLGYLTESDKRLSTFVEEVNALQGPDKKIAPHQLLALQVKLGFIQQELEFFTAVLNKSLESTKTVMNVQI